MKYIAYKTRQITTLILFNTFMLPLLQQSGFATLYKVLTRSHLSVIIRAYRYYIITHYSVCVLTTKGKLDKSFAKYSPTKVEMFSYSN